MGIVVIGSVFVDIKGYPSSAYIPGGRNAGKVRYVHGGVSRNIAEDLGNMGLGPAFISLVDPTGTGEDVLQRLRDHGVDTRPVRKVPEGMGTWLAVFDNNNDVCASISHRPDLCPLLDTLHDEGNRLFRSADSVVLELDLEEPVVEEVYRLKNKYGIPVFAAVSNISIALARSMEHGPAYCARPSSTILGAEPWIASNMARRSPMLALPAVPTPP